MTAPVSLFPSWGSVVIHEVAPGTVIEHNGQKITVTDENAVNRGDQIWVTPKIYAALKARAK